MGVLELFFWGVGGLYKLIVVTCGGFRHLNEFGKVSINDIQLKKLKKWLMMPGKLMGLSDRG